MTGTGLGSILIAGLGSLLICMFLGPKFIAEARQREFGQLIREEGPEGHHAKAGTPTMGGILIFVAVTIPFLILGSYDAVSLSVWGIAMASHPVCASRHSDSSARHSPSGVGVSMYVVG